MQDRGRSDKRARTDDEASVEPPASSEAQYQPHDHVIREVQRAFEDACNESTPSNLTKDIEDLEGQGLLLTYQSVDQPGSLFCSHLVADLMVSFRQ